MSMVLAKERTPQGSQARALYGYIHGGGPPLDPSPLELFGYLGQNNVMLDEGEGSDSLESYSGSLLPILPDPGNSSGGSLVFGAAHSSPQEAQSVVDFKGSAPDHWGYPSSSLLSFEQGERVPRASYSNLNYEDECATWIDSMDQNYQMHQLSVKCSTSDSRLVDQDQNCFEMASAYGLMNAAAKDSQHGEERFGLLYPGANAVHGLQDQSAEQEKGLLKRPCQSGDMQVAKKHCGNTRKSKAKPSSSKDPQSIAAKNRRERISERLKILQDLVPNGTKVDLVTMLEKAISYVKFLQLQVKVLATDEFWPAQGGKAAEVSQVKEAIEAILSSQRDRNSSSMQ